MGLGGLPAILPSFLQNRGPGPGHHLSERTARSFILLPPHFVAGQERCHLDDVELSALLWLETDAAIPDQPATAGPVLLAALSKPSRIFTAQSGHDRWDRIARRRAN